MSAGAAAATDRCDDDVTEKGGMTQHDDDVTEYGGNDTA